MTGAVGAVLTDSLVVRVVDDEDRPVPSVSVDWRAVTSGVSVSPSQTLTDRRGLARTSVTLMGQARRQEVIARVLTVNGPQTVSFGVRATPGATETVRVTPVALLLGVGQTQQIAATITDAAGNEITEQTPTWSSSNPAVATVDSRTGRVTGVAVGTADITATSGGKTGTARVRVASGTISGSDPFDSNSTAAYTQFADLPASWTLASGALVALGASASQSVFVRTAEVFQNGWVEAEMDQADEGGLVLRFRDRENYLLLAVRDDGSLLGTRNLELYRRVNGQFDLLAFGVDVAWPRGVSKTLRFEADGTALRGYIDGRVVVEAIDASTPAPGAIGMRYHDVPEDPDPDLARYLTLRWMGL